MENTVRDTILAHALEMRKHVDAVQEIVNEHFDKTNEDQGPIDRQFVRVGNIIDYISSKVTDLQSI